MLVYVIIAIGLVFGCIGIYLFIKRIGDGQTNKIKIIGMEFEITSSALVIFVVGAALIVTGANLSSGNAEPVKPNIKHDPVIDNKVPPVNTPPSNINYDSIFNIINTNELSLARYGETAYKEGDYENAIRFLERARNVQSSKVWESSLPYLIAAYWQKKRNADANAALSLMYSEAQNGPGYLNSRTTVGFLINSFGNIKNTLPLSYNTTIDEIVERLIRIKNQLPE